MSVAFKMIPKKNNLVSPPETKYFPCAVSQGKVGLDELASLIAMRSTMSKADCYGVIIALSEAVSEALSQGKIVEMGDLGSLQITLLGTPADTPEDLGKSNIKKGRVVYKPSKDMKNMLKGLKYKRIR